MQTVRPTDGMIITEDTRLESGIYALPNGIRIAADNVTIEGEGVHLVGLNYQSVGIAAQGRRGLTVKNVMISNYYHGIRFDDCEDIKLSHTSITRTAEVEPYVHFLYLWKPIEEAFGAAVLLNNVDQAHIEDNDLQHQLNGVMLYGCSRVTVARNNTSFNSGWGIYLSNSSDNLIEDNTSDFCNRVYRRADGTERVEADAAGLVMVHGSSRNKVLRNKFRCGGDGIFIVGYEYPEVIKGCNDNLIEDNDCSFSPNNAIESTFCEGNIFRRNICSASNYGFWMGFSWENLVEDNTIADNRIAGVALEHGHHVRFINNRFLRNREGMRLWTRGIAVLEYWPTFQVAHDFDVERNLFADNGIGLNGYTGPEPVEGICYGYHVNDNTFRSNRYGVRFAAVRDSSIARNQFENNVQSAILLDGETGVEVGENSFTDNTTDVLRR
jgi:parallel beta-helix repeat protein